MSREGKTVEEALQEWAEAVGKDVPTFMEMVRAACSDETLRETNPTIVSNMVFRRGLAEFRISLRFCIPSWRTLREHVQKVAYESFPDPEDAETVADTLLTALDKTFSSKQMDASGEELRALISKVIHIQATLEEMVDPRSGGLSKN